MRPTLFTLIFFASISLSAQTSCDSLTTLLGSMLDQYDALSVENEQVAFEMNMQRTQIDSLRSAVHRGNYDLDKALKEAKVLRSIMTGFVVTIDSLNRSNHDLQRKLDEQKK